MPKVQTTPPALSDERLAVVIPAYKGRHLAATLAAFAAQTDRRFRLYIADDGSPEDLAAVVAPFRPQLDLVYHRFPDNLGHSSLAAHWDRAIALGRENWIWLFSDDDLVSPDCVAAFWAARAQAPAHRGLFRWHCAFIDTAGAPFHDLPILRYPEHQSWDEHVRSLLRPGALHVCNVQNVAFPRELYRRHGGFPDYPLGFWSDWIAWARFARDAGIVTLPAGSVFFRIHPGSIGGQVFAAQGDRCQLLGTAGRLFADFATLYAGSGRRFPRLAALLYFSRLFAYAPRPLNAAERRAAATALALGWPRWPGLREAVFWWHAGRPALKQVPWIASLARRRLPRTA